MAEIDVSELITVEQAVGIIDSAPAEPTVRKVALHEAQGLRLAADLRTDRDYPPFDKSLMDGYAVRAQDVATVPVELDVIGEVAAGQNSSRQVGPGQAVSIMTGAPLPPGADAVVPVEHTEQLGQRVRVRQSSPSRYVSTRGSDSPAGRIVLPRGTVLEGAQLAVAATVGSAAVEVFARPTAAVLSTGDELVPVDQVPGPGQIRDSNGLMLGALLRRLGCEVADSGTVRDDPQQIRSRIEAAQQHQMLFITGGMSMGRYDYVPGILQEMGYELKITKLRIKPGKPFVFATKRIRTDAGEKPHYVFGLPGNPVSSFVCTVRLASRLIRRLSGLDPADRWSGGWLRGRLPANGPREFYLPVIRSGWMVLPLQWKGSADVFTLAAANALLVREPDAPAQDHGEVRLLEI